MKDYSDIFNYTQKLKLLYVEDHEESRILTLEILKTLFKNIVVASNGKEGLDKFIHHENDKDYNKIDIIITDINMPIMDGLSMVEKIRKINEDIPVIILSAHSETKYFVRSINIGVNNFLFKPMDVNKLISILKNTLEKLILKNEAKENLQLLREYQDVIDKSSIVSKTNPAGIITYVNDEFCKISGYSKEELVGKSHNIVRHPDNTDSLYKDLWLTIKKRKKIWQGMMKNISKSNKDYYVNSTVKPILDNNNEIIEYISVRHDVTQLVELHKKVESLRLYDIEQQLTAREKLDIGIVNQLDDNEVKVIYAPLDILSGDFYSLYRCKDGPTFIYLIDGQGHGISPALTVFSVSSTINNIINSTKNLEKLIEHVFPVVQTFLGDEEQLSFTMIMISQDSKTIAYCSGGMYPFLLKTADGIIKIKANNTPFMNFSPNPVINEIQVNEFDSLVVYSDGLVEHENKDLDKYRPENIINEPSLIESAIETIAKSELEDDVTLLYIKK